MDTDIEIYRLKIRRAVQGAPDTMLSWWLDGGGAWLMMQAGFPEVRMEEIRAEISQRASAIYPSGCIADLIWSTRDG